MPTAYDSGSPVTGMAAEKATLVACMEIAAEARYVDSRPPDLTSSTIVAGVVVDCSSWQRFCSVMAPPPSMEECGAHPNAHECYVEALVVVSRHRKLAS